MKTEIIKSFEFKDIINNDMRKFECWGSVEVTDRHNEVIPADEIYKVMDIWMDRGSPIMFNHTNRQVGKGINWKPMEKDGKPGVLITGVIYKHYAEDDEIWAGIKKGEFEGLSIGGKSYTRDKQPDGTTYLRDLIGYEFSVVERCGNQEATFTQVNQMAKSEEIKKEEPIMDETPEEEKSEDVMAQIQEMLASLSERISNIESVIAGAPEEEEAVEEQKEESEEEEAEEEEKEEAEEEDNMQKAEIELLKKEVLELKKNAVKNVIKTERPAEKTKELSAHEELRKSIKQMGQSGKVDLKAVGKQLRGIQ